MKLYKMVEMFTSIKGEGVNTGIPMMFVRFAGCNLRCNFCDTPDETKFEITEDELIRQIFQLEDPRTVVFTGGEPALQLQASLVATLKAKGLTTVLETNGVEYCDAFDLIDYVTISPKKNAAIAPQWYTYEQRLGRPISEIRYIVADEKGPDLLPLNATHKCISPMFEGGRGMLVGRVNHHCLKWAIELVQQNRHLGYRLSVQVHKLIGVR